MLFSDKIKFISDENIPIKVVNMLKERGFDIKRVPLGFSDKRIAKIAKSESRIILTFDRHFINRKMFPPEKFSGIIFLQIHPPIIESIFSSLLKLLEEVKPEEFKGKLFVLSSFGFKVRQ